MKRGSLWIGSGRGVYVGKPRPILVVQSALFDQTSSITICPITSSEIEAGFARVQLGASAFNGLRETSWVMVDKITRIARASVSRQIGELSVDDLLAVERALKTFLGLQ